MQCGVKSTIRFLVGGFLATMTVSSFAVLPPKYLQVKDFKKCLGQQEVSTYLAWCMPAKKAKSCSQRSWKQLRALSGQDKIPACGEAAASQ